MNTQMNAGATSWRASVTSMEVNIPSTNSTAKTVAPRQAVIDAFHSLQAYAILWSVTLTVMLVDDAAMLALAFC